ncbi:MAG: tetratricopeptide repeat protein [Pseudomonadota bacterium]
MTFQVRLITCIILTVFCFSGTACAAKRVAGGAARPAGKAPAAQMPDSSLEDVAAGLSDFEKRASHYSRDEWNFVLGYAHYRHGRWKDAEELLHNAAAKLPAVADHVVFYRAVCALNLGRPAEALDLLDELQGDHPDSVWLSKAKVERARALIALKRYNEARKALEDYKKQGDAEKDFDADLLIARSFIDEGDGDGAANLVRSLAISADSEEKLAELKGLVDEVKTRFRVDIRAWLDEPARQFHLAESFADRMQWDEAASRLEKLVALGRIDGALFVQAKWLLARCYRSIHRYDEAIKLMEGLLSDSGSAGFSDNLLSTLATTYTKKNDYAKAIALRRRMMERAAPGSSQAAQMAFKIAFLYMDEGKYDEAIPLWRQAVGMRGAKQEEARWFLAWSCHLAGKDSEALSIIDGMLEKGARRSGIHDRLLYWKGRVLDKMGRTADARGAYSQIIEDHPSGYYAELAKRKLDGDRRDIGTFALVKDAGRASARHERAPAVNVGGSSHLARAALFDRWGLSEESGRELRAAPFSGSEEALYLASKSFAHDVAYRFAEGRYHDALKGTPGSGNPGRLIWEAAYPRAYEPLVLRLVRGSDVDPMLIWSIMRNESTFRPDVVSPAGAVGLMQLMPTTANRLAKEGGAGQVDRRDLYRPAVNAAWGVAYLKKLSGLFAANPVAWVASYNAGEEAVARWIKNGSLKDIEEWIEEIPYDETNLYVKKVLVSYWKYQRLYGR